jgi:signal transduction histidine kinase
MKPSSHRATITFTMAGCSLVTLAALALPWVRFSYRLPGMHIALEMAAALVALLATFLVAGRFIRSHLLTDLLLTAALGILAWSNLCFSALPSAATDGHPHSTWLWLAVSGQLLGASALGLATLARPVGLQRPGRAAAQAAIVSAALVMVVATLASHFTPDIVSAGITAAGEPPLVDHSAVDWIEFLTMLAFATAAIGLLRRVDAVNDPMLAWFAAGAVAATFARLDFFLYPSLLPAWVYLSDVLRLVSYLLLLVGTAAEIGSYWRGLSEAAVLEERRRMARDLHDGLAQELAFISRLARDPGADAGEIQASADRALDESRRAIAALTRPLDEPLEQALAQAVEEVAARGCRVPLLQVELPSGLRVQREVQETLIRVACEAVSNATRHGHADTVRVRVDDRNGLELLVLDDGVGFDPDELDGASGRFGILGMRERVESLGGRFAISSSASTGTRVEVAL